MALRPNTERPVTITQGTNKLCTLDNIYEMIDTIFNEDFSQGKKPPLWDGKTAQRVADSI